MNEVRTSCNFTAVTVLYPAASPVGQQSQRCVMCRTGLRRCCSRRRRAKERGRSNLWLRRTALSSAWLVLLVQSGNSSSRRRIPTGPLDRTGVL